MPHSRRFACVVFCLGVGLVSGCTQGPGQSAGRIWEVGQGEPDAALSAAVEAKLNETGVKFEFSGIAFSDVVQYLRDASNCSIYVNWNALEAVGIERNAAVNVRLQLRGVTMRTGLRAILDDVGGANPLGFAVRSGVLVISTADDLSRHTVVRIYDVSDLMAPRAMTDSEKAGLRDVVRNALDDESGRLFGPSSSAKGPSRGMTMREACERIEANLPAGVVEAYMQFQADRLAEVILTTVAPDSWQVASGNGSLQFLGSKMVICHTPMAHREIADLLAALREQTAPMPAAKPAPAPQRPARAQANRKREWCGVRPSD